MCAKNISERVKDSKVDPKGRFDTVAFLRMSCDVLKQAHHGTLIAEIYLHFTELLEVTDSQEHS